MGMKRRDYLECQDKLYAIYFKWVAGIERTEEDFKEFYRLREYVSYYECSRRGKQQRAVKRLLTEKLGEKS